MSERERLLGRQLPPTPFRLQIDHTPAAESAAAELEAAREAIRIAQSRDQDLQPFATRVLAAEAAFEPHCMVLQVRVIPADLYEDLELAHPATPDQAELGYRWNIGTFAPALLEACVDGDMTVDDWAQLRRVGGHVAAGEINSLVNLCLEVNDRSPDPYLGKG